MKGQIKGEMLEYVESKGLFFYRADRYDKDRYEFVLFSEEGEILDKGYKYIKHRVPLMRYVLISLWLSCVSCLSIYLGINRVRYGWIPILVLVFLAVPAVID